MIGLTTTVFLLVALGAVSESKELYQICESDEDCNKGATCQNEKCIDLCDNECGYHAECVNVNDGYKCACPDGYQGDPMELCYECKLHVDCSTHFCYDYKCLSPCTMYGCGEGAICENVKGKSKCTCPPGSDGNPFEACDLKQLKKIREADLQQIEDAPFEENFSGL